ncbi:NFACT family protein [Synechococcus sp. RSCCF101]|uniref:NFACT family protein n=1 Tax=Synechococcus sp. RSCCF101 TaxID=2511069 RepID=UPI003519F379
MDLTSLRAVLSELRPALVPSRFEKAQQPDPHTLQLALRTLSGLRWLEISWLAEAPRLLLIPPPPRCGDGSTLARQLQHSLHHMALCDVVQRGFERVVELPMAQRPGAVIERRLVVELMGRHSNVLLLDEGGRVITLARQVSVRQSRLRPLATGDPYQPPPAPGGGPRWRMRPSSTGAIC